MHAAGYKGTVLTPVSQDRPGIHWWRAGGDGAGGGHWRGPAHQLRRVQRHFQWGLKYRSYQCCIVFCSPGWCNVCHKWVAMIAVNLLSCTVKYFGLFWGKYFVCGLSMSSHFAESEINAVPDHLTSDWLSSLIGYEVEFHPSDWTAGGFVTRNESYFRRVISSLQAMLVLSVIG